MDNLQADWLAKLSRDWQAEQKRTGYLVVDAQHVACRQLWLGLVHRSSMGQLECPDCGGRDGCTVRVYGRTQEGKLTARAQRRLAERWPDLDPIIHRVDGSIEEGKPL